jgi:hypothetical protein
MAPQKPYPVLVIAAFVCFAIVLMLWVLIGTNGPTSRDAGSKPPAWPPPDYRTKRLFRLQRCRRAICQGIAIAPPKVRLTRLAEADELPGPRPSSFGTATTRPHPRWPGSAIHIVPVAVW